MRVKEWITPGAETIDPWAPVTEAWSRMRAGGFRRLVVVEGGELVGVVTDRDLRRARPSEATTLSAGEAAFLLHRLPVREVMGRPVYAIDEDSPLEAAARTMLNRRIGGLPVIDGRGRLAGVITETDLPRAFVDQARATGGG